MQYNQELEKLHQEVTSVFDEKEKVREEAFSIHRKIIKLAGNSIKAMHRGEDEKANELLKEAHAHVENTRTLLSNHRDVYHAGFVHSAQKEYSEARIFQAVIHRSQLPLPKELNVDIAPYLNGMGEAVGEMRRYLLDRLRHEVFQDGETILQTMDDFLYFLSSLDYPDALTEGLRRTADITRSIIEKTRGDLTNAVRQHALEETIRASQKL